MPKPAAPRWTLRLAGPPRAVAAGGASITLEPRAAALLALAALEPGGVARERAALWLWPDSDDPRRNLRQQLLRFRRQFGGEVLGGQGQLQLAVGIAVSTEGRELLEDLTFSDLDELQTWLERQRSAHRQRRLEPLLDALAKAEAEGALGDALSLANQWLAAAPHSEAAHRALMRVHYLRGDGTAGLATYGRLAQMLQSSHGAAPQPETEALAQALRQASRPALGSAWEPLPPQVPPTLLRPPHLVGREAEQRAVREAWARQQVAWLIGEAGLGKTRLVDALCAAHPEPARVARAQGRPGDAGVPYATLGRLLRTLVPRAPPLPDERRLQLARVLPELAPAQPLPAEGHRPALQAALQAVLVQAAPQLLALDDLHFADDASVQMLAALAAEAPDGPQRWLLAARPAEGGAAARAWHEALAEEGRLAQVPLAPLDLAAMAELVRSLGLPQLDAEALAPELLRHTGGNPLFALETLKAHLGRGASDGVGLPRPASVGLLIERRLKQLSPPALALARMAAVSGIDFDLPLAEQVLGASTLALADAWAELEAAQVLRDQAFAHDLVHEAALHSMPATVARRLHAQVATQLHQRGAEPASIASHWLAAGEPIQAVPHQVAAAERALQRFQRGEAGQHLLDAAEALRHAGRAEESFELLFRCGEAWSELTEPQRFEQLREAMFALAGNDAQWARAWMIDARLCDLQGRYADLGQAGQRVLEHAQRCGDRSLQAHGLNCQYTAAYWAGRLTEALAAAERARMLWAELGRADDAATALYIIGVVQQALGRLDEADASYEDGAARAEALKAWPLLAPFLRQRALVQMELGHHTLAGDLINRALQWLDRIDAAAEDWSRPVATWVELLRGQGRYREALAQLQMHATRFGARAAATDWALHIERLWLMLELGRPHAALQAWREAKASPADTLVRHWQLHRGARALQVAGVLLPTDMLAPLPALQDRRAALLVARADASIRPAPERAEQLGELGRQALALGLRSQALALAAERLEALLQAGEQKTAAAEAAALVLQLHDASPAIYPPAAWWAVHRALLASNAEQAGVALEQARAWIAGAMADHVPAEFQASFREHNLVNRAVLASPARRRSRTAG